MHSLSRRKYLGSLGQDKRLRRCGKKSFENHLKDSDYLDHIFDEFPLLEAQMKQNLLLRPDPQPLQVQPVYNVHLLYTDLYNENNAIGRAKMFEVVKVVYCADKFPPLNGHPPPRASWGKPRHVGELSDKKV
ncbi:hypothetical protein Tco_1318564 [Tanacetum coccineum]